MILNRCLNHLLAKTCSNVFEHNFQSDLSVYIVQFIPMACVLWARKTNKLQTQIMTQNINRKCICTASQCNL